MYIKVWESVSSWATEPAATVTGVKTIIPSETGGFAVQLETSTLVLPNTTIVEIFEG